jgi:hypothetical protein
MTFQPRVAGKTVGGDMRLEARRIVAVLLASGFSGCALDGAPGDEEDVPGLVAETADGDGEVLVPRDPCASFIADRADREAYAVALSEEVCAIDLQALAAADVRWTRETPVEIHDGSAYQLLASPTGDEAIVASYRFAAFDFGLIETCEAPGQQQFVTLAAAAARACARSPGCRGAVVKAAKAVVAGVSTNAIWDGIKKLFD